MAQEIERKFLVKGDFKGEAFKATRPSAQCEFASRARRASLPSRE